MEIGEKLPDLELKDHHNRPFNFSELELNKALVVYFYPKDFTPGCTREACDFRDHYEDFKAMGAEVIGISTDSANSHARFVEKYRLPYIFLTDENKLARKAFGVKPNLLGLLPGRETFVFNGEGILVYKFNSMNAGRHITQVLNFLKENKN